jgi:hypothetical protein
LWVGTYWYRSSYFAGAKRAGVTNLRQKRDIELDALDEKRPAR